MLSPDELIKAKREQKEKEKQEEYLRYQAKQKATAAKRARINEILQILKQYPTLAKNVGKKPYSRLCYDGLTGFFDKTAKSTYLDVWLIGGTNFSTSTSAAKAEKINTAFKNSGVKRLNMFVSADSYGHSYYIDEKSQCWISLNYYDRKSSYMLFPMEKEEMAEALWNDCITRYNTWENACTGNTWQEREKFRKELGYIPDEQVVDEYFKLNLLYNYN